MEENFARQLLEERRRLKGNGTALVVECEDVAAVAAEWTGIPVQRIRRSEGERLLHLEEEMGAAVVGQAAAVRSIARAIRRARMGLKEPERPVGSFLFLGSTGVGKTALCRALARSLFGGEEAMIRLDMSEYAEGHSVSRLVGSPPGYVGHDDGGQLTERVRRRPYSVVLFDEIEKAHADVWNLLLQIMEDGRLTDSHGREVDFRNTVIIMTGNVGARHLSGTGGRLGFSAGEQEERARGEKAVEEELRRVFPPEFLNRVDDTIIFRKLTEEDLREIARRMIGDTAARLAARKITLSADDGALDLLARESGRSDYGARPMRRLIRAKVEEPIADGILDGMYRPNDDLVLRAAEGELVVTRRNGDAAAD